MHPDTDRHPGTNRFVSAIMIISCFLIPLIIALFVTIWKTPAEPPEIKAIVEEWEAENKKLTSSTPPEKNAWKYYGEAADILKTINFGDNGKIYGDLSYMSLCLEDPGFMNAVSAGVQLHPEILELADRGYEKGMVFPPINLAGDYNKDKHTALIGFIIFAGTVEEENNKPLIAAKRYLQAIHLGNGWFRSNAHFFHCIGNIECSITKLLRLMEKEKQNRELMVSVLENTDRISDEWTTFKADIVYYIFMIRNDMPAYNLCFEEKQRNSGEGIIGYIKYGIKKKTTEKELLSLYKVILQYNKYTLESYSKTMSFTDSIPCPGRFSVNVFGPLVSGFESSYTQYTRLHTKFDAVRLLAALNLYRLDNGEYPENLNLLSPKYLKKIPRDEFASDGKFIYKKKNDGGIILYSVGSDMKDDGGKSIEDMRDIVFVK